jgi:hypothetical protein
MSRRRDQGITGGSVRLATVIGRFDGFSLEFSVQVSELFDDPVVAVFCAQMQEPPGFFD